MPKELYLYNPIFSFTAENLISSMEENSAEDIVIRVNSPGGSVHSGWGIIAKMQEREGKTKIKVDGAAMSMAAIALLFADEVEALDVSTIMLHRAAMFVESDEDQKYLDRINKDIRAKMEKKINSDKLKEISGFSIAEMFENKDRVNVFLTAKEAKAIGLVDSITKVNPKEVEALNIKLFSVAALAEPEQKNKPSKMTLSSFKQDHPEIYAQALAEGVAKEKARAEVWAHFIDEKQKDIREGIASGKDLSDAQKLEYMEKRFSAKALKNLEGENAEGVKTTATENLTADQKKEADAKAAFDKALDEELKKYKTK